MRCLEEPGDSSAYPDLLTLLMRLAVELGNPRFESQTDAPKATVPRKLQSDYPEIFRIICGGLRFLEDERRCEWNYTNGRLSYFPTMSLLTAANSYRPPQLLHGSTLTPQFSQLHLSAFIN